MSCKGGVHEETNFSFWIKPGEINIAIHFTRKRKEKRERDRNIEREKEEGRERERKYIRSLGNGSVKYTEPKRGERYGHVQERNSLKKPRRRAELAEQV